MIDLHCHILPELDDGSQSLEESLAMARMAVNSGVRAMAATPHCMGERAEEVYGTWSLLRQALEETGVPLKLVFGEGRAIGIPAVPAHRRTPCLRKALRKIRHRILLSLIFA